MPSSTPTFDVTLNSTAGATPNARLTPESRTKTDAGLDGGMSSPATRVLALRV